MKSLVKRGKDERGAIALVLRPLRRKLWQKNIIHYATRGLLFGMCLAMLPLLVARIVPVWYVWAWVFLIVGSSFVGGLMLGLWRRPHVKEAARFADRAGLQERMVTALTFQHDKSLMANVQREQAVAQFHREEDQVLKHLAMWRLPRWMRISFVLCVMVGALLWFLPNPMDDIVKEQQQVQQTLAEQAQEIAEQQENIAKNDTLTEEQQEDLQRQLQKLQDQLADSKNLQEGMEALATAEAALERLAEQSASEQQATDQLQAQLAAHKATQGLADALAEMDGSRLQDALQDVHDALASLTDDEREALAEQLAQTASSLADNSELSDEELVTALREASKGLQAGDMGSASAALHQAVSEAIAGKQASTALADAASQATQTVSNSQQALAQAGQSSTAGNATAQNSGSTGGQNNSNGNTNSHRTSGANGQNNGAGNNHGSGSGAGQGSAGSGNSGSGSGTGRGTGTSGSEPGGSGAGLGSGSHELVSIPSARIEGGGPQETVGGPLGEGEETVQSHGPTIGLPGVNRPYTEVFGQYEQAARQALQRSDLPPQYQQLIKDYFTDIKPKE